MPRLSNAEIANVLLGLAQMLSVQKENPFKIKAYRRAAKAIADLPESIEEVVRSGGDLTSLPGIGKSISGAIQEIVERGGVLEQLESRRADVGEDIAALSEYPRLDPKRVQRIYKAFQITSIDELKDVLQRGEIGKKLGTFMERHVREGLSRSTEILLYEAHRMAPLIEKYLREKCGVPRVEAAGAYRRRVETLGELSFVVQADDFPRVTELFQSYGGKTDLVEAHEATAVFQLPSGVRVRLANTTRKLWGLSLLLETGSEEHIEKLVQSGHDLKALLDQGATCSSEESVYRKLGLQPIPAELRNGRDEVELAAGGRLPKLVTLEDIRGELHSHTTASDGMQTVEQMAASAVERGYEYLGITDHSQSLTIARGVPEADLWKQIRRIDQLNATGQLGVRVLKSAEVDILEDGSLDYSDALLKELDYTVCSIHSKFSLGKAAQTERILRAMDNRYFNILGHATGRRLLKRPGYEVDLERLVEQARTNGCFFEINSSPERLDVSEANARLAWAAGVKIALNTDAHSTREFDYIALGVQQARRAGLESNSVLNCMSWAQLERLLRR